MYYGCDYDSWSPLTPLSGFENFIERVTIYNCAVPRRGRGCECECECDAKGSTGRYWVNAIHINVAMMKVGPSEVEPPSNMTCLK
jgi:hypothetical protein